MNAILFPVIFVSALGILLGLGLSIASKFLALPADETADRITEALPGANCGACGFSGCAGYAAALSGGKTKKTNLCGPGGTAAAAAVAEILGVKAETVIPTAAVVLCQGNTANAQVKMIYHGVKSCRMATQLFGGYKECAYGCLGLGDCMDACEYDAIHICDGVARTRPIACHSCRACVSACPKGLIKMLPLGVPKASVLCNNQEKGAVSRKQCKAACIGCKKCENVCESGAVTVKDFLARVDPDKCTGCGKCTEVCPVGCIEVITL